VDGHSAQFYLTYLTVDGHVAKFYLTCLKVDGHVSQFYLTCLTVDGHVAQFYLTCLNTDGNTAVFYLTCLTADGHAAHATEVGTVHLFPALQAHGVGGVPGASHYQNKRHHWATLRVYVCRLGLHNSALTKRSPFSIVSVFNFIARSLGRNLLIQ